MKEYIKSNMQHINWGIIGCGDVAEIKSGPAFQKTAHSSLVAVMRRNAEKAEDFARRHHVPYWYNEAGELLNNDAVDAVYIATPPSTHLHYALEALQAGKDVYLEKPMARTAEEARQIDAASRKGNSKLTIAHYRRRLPAFLKIKSLIEAKAIGDILVVDIQILQPQKSELIANSEEHWRVNPAISGGGYFYDLAPHQIDLMYYFFGHFKKVSGFSHIRQDGVEDVVNGIIVFQNGVQFRGIWNFRSAAQYQKDQCIIYGTKGSIAFSFYGAEVTMIRKDAKEVFSFKNPQHIQQPMIEAVTHYFMGNGENPCPSQDGVVIMETMEKLCGKVS